MYSLVSLLSGLFLCVLKSMGSGNLIFFGEIARARTWAMWQLIFKRGLWEPNCTNFSPQVVTMEGKNKNINIEPSSRI